MNMKLNTLRDVYKTFETAEDRAAKILAQSSSDPATQNNVTPFRALVDLLYPNPAGAFYSGEDLWQKLQEIFAAKSDETADDNSKKLKEFLVESVRVYYTTFTGDKSSLEESIKDFYTRNRRESAYIGWSRIRDAEGSNYRAATLKDMVVPPNVSQVDSTALSATSLMYILVDTPVIDLKIRRSNEAEVFLNYMPSVVTAQLVPYLSAEFTLNRKVRGQRPGRELDTMGQLRFLLGDPGTDGSDGLGSTDRQIYDALNTTKLNAPGDLTTREKIQNSLKIRNKLVANLIAAPSTNENRVTGTRTSSTGMDIFTMPQTLVNLDYRQDQNPRYNPVLNPVLPFGTITGVSINIAPSTGVMSFKTATLNIKIFDRSRLVEIADFINPRLYKSVTVWLTYGWRAPEFSRSEASSAQTYYDFINQNMLVREAFGVKNSGMTIESDGTVSLTISLYTLGGLNILQAKDSLSNEYEDLEARLGENLARLAELAKSLGLQAFLDVGQEVRGAQLIGAAMRGDLIGLDFTTLEQELLAIKKSLAGSSDPQAAEFIGLLTDIYAKSGSGQAAVAKGKSTSQKLSVLEDMEAVARQLTNIRFDGLKDAVDLFGEDSTPTGKYKNSEKERISPLMRMFKSFKDNQESKPKNSSSTNTTAQVESGRTLAEDTQVTQLQFGPFGTCSFGRVFAYYFGQVASALSKSEIIDEFQVVFYKINDLAGSVAGINVAEFPIDIAALERAYADRVNKQKGENMSFNLFLEVVRQSQFSDMRSLAYGFRDFYQEDRKTNQLVPIPGTQEELSQRLLMNGNRGGPFTIPAIDFYIEAGYAQGSTKVYTDLLDAINFFSARPSDTGVPGSLRRILRIHIYDKASRPNKVVAQMLAGNPAGTYVELNDTYLKSQVPVSPDSNAPRNVPAETLDAIRGNETLQANSRNKETPTNTLITQVSEAVNSVVGGTFQSDKAFSVYNFKDASGKNASFEKVKQVIAARVPTITLGSNGSTVTSVSYSTNQDALLSTIMMLRNPQNATNPSKPNGTAEGDLPLRVIPGALSVNTLGCPIVEYMQQFFVDLGTGTTVDNLYNITGLTHNMSPGKFETQIKFTFEDAYGKYESPQSLIDGITGKLSYMKTQQENGKDKKKPGGK